MPRELPNKNKCMIDSCKIYNTCNKKQIKGKGVKCINYVSPFGKD